MATQINHDARQNIVDAPLTLVLAAVQGYPAEVHVGTKTMAQVRLMNRQRPELRNDERFHTWNPHKPAIVWLGFTYSRSSVLQTENFASN